jgi:glycosyltransferase involved in cell wall biosynthesis
LKIAVNTRLLLKDKLEGIGWFSYETLKRITNQHPEHEFLFLFDRPFDKSFVFSDNVKPIILFPQARHPFLYYFYFEYSIPRILKKEKVDLFLSPDGFLSLNTSVPQLPVIHDLNFEHYPEALPKLTSLYYRKFFPQFARKATRIATVSEFSKQDIAQTYGISESKIDVVYNGVNCNYELVSEKAKSQYRHELTGGTPYFIYVGSLHPRKNLVRLLKAYDQFRKKTGLDVAMVLVGEAMWGNSDVESQIAEMKYKKDVISTGRLEPDELLKTIGSAMAMTFVPLFEGFGIPALEAMQCGVPLIVSNRTSFPEVVGNAAALVNPDSIEEISGAMQSVAKLEDLRIKMISLGLEQSQKFSWDRSAELLWASIEKAL